MDGGPGDEGNDKPKDKRPASGKLIVLPGGKDLDPKEIGADYVLGPTGHIPTPDIVDPVAGDRELRERTKYVKGQELVSLASRNAPTSEMVDSVLLEIAEELSHLKFERRKASRDGKNTAQYTVNRIAGLKALTELLLKRKEAALAERLDLKSPRFQAIFKVWMDFFYEAMSKAGVESNVIDLVFQQMKADMMDWEKKMDMAGVEGRE